MKAIGTYSLFQIHNDTLYSSGILGIDEKLNIDNDFERQLEQVFKNIEYLLNINGLNFSSIIKTTVFLTNLENFSKINTYYQKYFQDNFPARTVVEVKYLPKQAQIEIEFIAKICK